MGKACCAACASGDGPCAGGVCDGKPAGAIMGDGTERHPVFARARTITGQHQLPGGAHRHRPAGDLGSGTPSDAELEGIGYTRDAWNAESQSVRDSFRVPGGDNGGEVTLDEYGQPRDTGATPPSSSMPGANNGGGAADRDAFEQELASLPADQRAAALRAYLNDRQASEARIAAGVGQLVNGGLGALSTWLRSDLNRDIANIHEGAENVRAHIREEGETARAEIAAATARYVADHGGNRPPPGWVPPTSNGSSGSDLLLGGLAVVAVGATLYALLSGGRR